MVIDRTALAALVSALVPGAELVGFRRFGDDDAGGDGDTTTKGIGYGKPVRVTLRDPEGATRDVVLHTAAANRYGHDQRADRAAELILAHDTFGDVPGHVRAIDVGFLGRDGQLRSIRDCTEAYLVTEYAPGKPYAEDLRRVARDRAATPTDERRVTRLASLLAGMHRRPSPRQPARYTRAIRDLVGAGEGIYGIVDGYPPDAPAASADRLMAIEAAAASYRWRLRGREERLCAIHGDFHPFNILFGDDDEPVLLDASRGCRGDAADDAVCLAINFPFFALGHDGAWTGGLRSLWQRFWSEYPADEGLLAVAPPYLAWRALVLASPVWYPQLAVDDRDRLLGWVERTLAAGRLDLDSVEELFPVTGVVVWLTGRPSSGKSTLAMTARDAIAATGRATCILDGDEVRRALVPAPAYDDTARDDFYATLAALAALLARQGLVVLVPATANRRAFRDRARAAAPAFVEVHVDVPAGECAARDAKGLYAAGTPDLPGVSPTAPYEPPPHPEVTANGGRDAGAVRDIIRRIQENAS